LPTALRLAGAQNLDIQIAREKVAEARANDESALWQFFPSLTAGVSYRQHDNLLQDVEGNIISVHKDSYTIGPTFVAQVDLGDAIYRKLATHQLIKAADFALESQRQDAVVAAAQGYLDLAKSQWAVAVANDAVRISTNYSGQVRQALEAGIAFKGDLLRVGVQTERDRLTLRQAQEQQRLAAARLAQTLHLDSTVELVPSDRELLRIELVSTNASLDSLVRQALSSRPELKQNHSLVEAAQQARKGAVYGPIIPTVGAQVFAGGLGGGRDGAPGRFGESEDYVFTLGWRIGPGGLFDRGRIGAVESRLKIAQLSGDKLADEITRQVVESQARLQSQADQVTTAKLAIQAAEETLGLSQVRKEFAVGAVLETIQAEQELTRARLDYLNALAEYDKAQYGLQRAIGGALRGSLNR
jgi:outer membrane protein TolC